MYPSLLTVSPFLKTGSSLVVTCYSTPSIPLTLRAIKSCELRNFQYKLISPCELYQTQLAEALSVRYFSHITESVFAFYK